MKKITLLFMSCLSLSLTCEPVSVSEDDLHLYISEFSQRQFNDYLSKTVLFPDVVSALAILESGNFSSEIFLVNNNPFGMRLARRRETTATGERNHFATYNHWVSAVNDFRLWQDYYLSKGYGLNDMLEVYCPLPDYKNRVMNIKNSDTKAI